AEIAAFDTLSGRRETTAEQRQLMLKTVGKMRERVTAVRLHPWAEGLPALHFVPGVCPVPDRETTGDIRPTVPQETPEVDTDNLETLAFQPVTVLSYLLRTRKITSIALTQMYLERLKRIGATLNCVVTVTEERALVEAARADREIENGTYRGLL